MPSKKYPTPTRNGTVPVPPASPVVSASINSAVVGIELLQIRIARRQRDVLRQRIQHRAQLHRPLRRIQRKIPPHEIERPRFVLNDLPRHTRLNLEDTRLPLPRKNFPFFAQLRARHQRAVNQQLLQSIRKVSHAYLVIPCPPVCQRSEAARGSRVRKISW